MVNILAVGVGGFLGAVSRYLVSLFCKKHLTLLFPIATLFVNTIGGFLIGFIMEYTKNSVKVSEGMKLFLTTGFLGGLTTFSTFSLETFSLLEKGQILSGALNVLLNLALSLIGTSLGVLLARALKPA